MPDLPRQRPDVTTFQEALRSGGVNVVNGLRALGYKGFVLDKYVGDVFVNLPYQDVVQLRRYTVEQARASKRANEQAPTAPIAGPQVPENRDLPERLRYAVIYNTTTTGPDGTLANVDSNEQLSRSRIRDIIESRLILQQIQGLIIDSPRGRPRLPGDLIGDIYIIGIFLGPTT